MFHRGFKHSKTIKALGLRPRAFISFLVFETPMKHLHSFFGILRKQSPRHLHMRIKEHKYSVIGKHLKDKHNQRPTNLNDQFIALKKCRGKFECLIYEMLLIKKKRPTLNTQNDSIPANRNCLFKFFSYFCLFAPHLF